MLSSVAEIYWQSAVQRAIKPQLKLGASFEQLGGCEMLCQPASRYRSFGPKDIIQKAQQSQLLELWGPPPLYSYVILMSSILISCLKAFSFTHKHQNRGLEYHLLVISYILRKSITTSMHTVTQTYSYSRLQFLSLFQSSQLQKQSQKSKV